MSPAAVACTSQRQSAVSALISSHAQQERIQASQALSSTPTDSGISTACAPSSPYTALALQVQHNLAHQHGWTRLALHTRSPLDGTLSLPRPLLSGLPPRRLYVHPEDQADELRAEQAAKRAGQAAKAAGAQSPAAQRQGSGAGESPGTADTATATATAAPKEVEREWVIPTHLREPWSLARFAEVFDRICEEPPDPSAESREEGGRRREGQEQVAEAGALPASQWQQRRRRRGGKRLLLATVSEDSAVSYYVVHDGIVKPRQH